MTKRPRLYWPEFLGRSSEQISPRVLLVAGSPQRPQFKSGEAPPNSRTALRGGEPSNVSCLWVLVEWPRRGEDSGTGVPFNTFARVDRVDRNMDRVIRALATFTVIDPFGIACGP